MPTRVLFVCTHNSARSQMAEGLLRARGGAGYDVASAGTEATAVRPEAIMVMAELGIDIGHHVSETIDRYLADPWDLVITVCDRARETCPFVPGARRSLHWSFDDPSEATGSQTERLAVFRRIRDEIDGRIRELLDQPAGTSGS